MRNNLLKLVPVLTLVIVIAAGGGCNSTAGVSNTTAIATTTQIRPFPSQETGIINASPQDISIWLSYSSRFFIFLDVRTPEEFAGGHINSAINIDYRATDFAQNIDKLDMTAYYIVYCRTGVRSAEASVIMQKHGFIHIVNMTGGITEWLNQNLDNIQKD